MATGRVGAIPLMHSSDSRNQKCLTPTDRPWRLVNRDVPRSEIHRKPTRFFWVCVNKKF